MDVKHGTFADRYTYDEIIVGSKTGETLMAFDEESLEFVVVKRPSLSQPNPDLYAACVADLEREERALRTEGIRDHPAVCPLLATGMAHGPEGEYRYLVLTRARGVPLPALLQQFREDGRLLPERKYLHMTRQLLDMLAAAHRAGVVYNDVKADHLFWDENAQQLKVIDWGNTQFDGEQQAVAADDVYQVGELLYEFITGERYSPVTMPDWEAAGRPTWSVTFRQPLAPQLAELVSTALHPDSEQRFENAAEMAAALAQYVDRKESRPSTEGAQSVGQAGAATAAPGRAVGIDGDGQTRATSTRVRTRPRLRVSTPAGRTLSRARLFAVGTAALALVIIGIFSVRALLRRPTVEEPVLPVVSALETPTPASTATPEPTEMEVTAEPATVADDCEALLAAERDGQWQTIADNVDRVAASVDSCDGRSLDEIHGVARYRLGAAAFQGGNYTQAVAHWTIARSLGTDQDGTLELLLACAAARSIDAPDAYAGLIDVYGAAVVLGACGFDPAAFLPTATPVSLRDINLLDAMEAGYVELYAECVVAPCPGLYQDETGRWHLNTFFENSEALLLLDSKFQIRSTGQDWRDGLRGGRVEFTVASLFPYSFPYGAQLGLGVSVAGGRDNLRLLLLSVSPFSVRAEVVFSSNGETACTVVAPGPYRLVGTNDETIPHIAAFQWDPGGMLQFFVDDQAVCAEPLEFPAAPQVALYLGGRGTHVDVNSFTVALASQ